MARPIWNGTISFGLLNIPVSLMPGERRVDLHFRMLDSRDKKPIRYERVNADTGDEVPWKEVVKAFEYHKGSYVVLSADDIKSAASDRREVIDIEAFIAADSIGPQFFEKPYFLVPGKKAEKGYVLLRETLRKSARMGIGRVVIRTREYLCAVLPQGEALAMNLLRYPQELVPASQYAFPSSKVAAYRISKKEFDMAEQLIGSMSGEWKPTDYRDEFRSRLTKVIERRMKRKGAVVEREEEDTAADESSSNVVDFVALLRKSLETNKRTPAKRGGGAARKVVKRAAAKKPAKRKVARRA
ncbi:MAG: Ku protein [Rudaea sp.]